eukprot:9506632-Alexandrium_andersonii.AAC.1
MCIRDSPTGEGGPPPQRLAGAPSESPPNGRCTMGESALTEQLRRAQLRGASSCCEARASSPIVRRPLEAAPRGRQRAS